MILRELTIGLGLIALFLSVLSGLLFAQPTTDSIDNEYGAWARLSPTQWPHITMINQIEYVDASHPIAGCGFLLETPDGVVAVTAKHVLMFFKSDSMNSVSFSGMLKQWTMFPKDARQHTVAVDRILNADTTEILKTIPPARDWLFLDIVDRSDSIVPLRMRETPVDSGETVYIVGWRYSDRGCPQVVYPGTFVREEKGSLLITTRDLADNTMPGLSGSPVIDSHGYLIGLMSQKAGEMERPASLDYARTWLKGRSTRDR